MDDALWAVWAIAFGGGSKHLRVLVYTSSIFIESQRRRNNKNIEALISTVRRLTCTYYSPTFKNIGTTLLPLQAYEKHQ